MLHTHLAALLQLIIAVYFSRLSTVLIVYESNCSSAGLQQEYLDTVQQAFRQEAHQGCTACLQWIDVAALSGRQFEQRILQAVDSGSEGFITVLSHTERFLHARYFATRNAQLRLKDKLYLFLCEDERPQDLLASELLQFYPHHLMIKPATAAWPPAGATAATRATQTGPTRRTAPLRLADTTINPKQITIQTTTKITLYKFTNASTSVTGDRTNTNLNPLSRSDHPILSANRRSTNENGTASARSSTQSASTTGNAAVRRARPVSLKRQASPAAELRADSRPIPLPTQPPPTPSSSPTTSSLASSSLSSVSLGQYRDIKFELWTQKFVGAAGSLEAVLLNAFLPNETFVVAGGAATATNTIRTATTPSNSSSPSTSTSNNNNNNLNVELFPDKVSNLKGRTLRVGSITYLPYVVTNYVPAGTGNVDPINPFGSKRTVSFVGSEAEIVKTFCQTRNCHLRVEPYGKDNWGIIDVENDTSSGMLGDVYMQRLELAIGCVYNWYNNVTETSHTIARSAVTILGPAPALYASWRTTIMPFSAALWLLLLITMIACTFVLYATEYAHFTLQRAGAPFGQSVQFEHCAALQRIPLDMLALFIQQSSAMTRKNSLSGRVFLVMLLGATVTLENTYSGQLKSIMTVPFYMEPVDTMAKWARTTWRWAAPSNVWVQTLHDSKLANEQILTQRFEVRSDVFLHNASFRLDYGLGIERLQSGSFGVGDFITAPALATKIVPRDDLYFDWTRAIAIRGWPLMPLFNKHVRACMETGLFVHWERQIVAKYMDTQIQNIMLDLALGHTTKSPPQKLTPMNVAGALFVLLIGYLIAGVVFTVEIAWYTLWLKIVH